jgi:hypothetical protein
VMLAGGRKSVTATGGSERMLISCVECQTDGCL